MEGNQVKYYTFEIVRLNLVFQIAHNLGTFCYLDETNPDLGGLNEIDSNGSGSKTLVKT